MIRVSFKVNWTACSALQRPPVVCHALGCVPVTRSCERTRAKPRRFPLAFCAGAAVPWAACWQRSQHTALALNRQALHHHRLQLKLRLGSQVKMFRLITQPVLQNCCATGRYWWSCTEGAKSPCSKQPCKPRPKYCLRQWPQVASLPSAHTLPGILVPVLQVTSSFSILLETVLHPPLD